MAHVGPGALTQAAGFAPVICRASLDWTGDGTCPYVVRALGQFSDGGPVYLHPLGWARDVSFVWTYPMAHYACAENVGDESIALAVPHEQRRARTATAVDFQKIGLLVGWDFDFVLHHPFGPEHAHHIGLPAFPETNGQIR